MVNRIIAAIDNCDRSQSVYDLAVSLAKYNANFMLLHVLSKKIQIIQFCLHMPTIQF